MSNVLFFEIGALVDGKLVDALTPGAFTDMLGRPVEFKQSELETYFSNTLQAINATRSESGEIVGLPIDARNHDKGDAAGWIVGVELAGNLVRVLPKWTEIGRDLIGRGIQRFFSATVDVANKVILGGTLTNWPAIRDKNGRVQLRPVELANLNHLVEVEQKEFIMNKQEETQEQDNKQELDLTAMREEIKAELMAELKIENSDGKVTELSDIRAALLAQVKEEVKADVANLVAEMKRSQKISEFSQNVTSGTEARPYGLPVGPEEVETFLLSLNDQQRAAAESILKRTHEQGLVEFSEIGHGKKLQGVKEFPVELSRSLDEWIKTGGTVKEYFVNAPELGDMAEYNLDEYEESK